MFFLYLIYVELRREASGCILPLTIIIIIPPPSRRRRYQQPSLPLRRRPSRTSLLAGGHTSAAPFKFCPQQGAGNGWHARSSPHVFVLGKGQQGDGRHNDCDGRHDGRRHDNHGKGRQAGGTTMARAADHGDRAHWLSYDGSFDNVLVLKTRAEGCLVFLRKVNPSGRGSLFDADPRPSIAYSNHWTDHRRNASGWCNTWH